jgi:hypothetical protein
MVAGLAPPGIPSMRMLAPGGFVVTEREPVPGAGDCEGCDFAVAVCAGVCWVIDGGYAGVLYAGGFSVWEGVVVKGTSSDETVYDSPEWRITVSV